MTSEFLLDTIGQLDDDLVLEAAVPAKHTTPWLKVAGWAAAVVLCVGIASIPGLLPMNCVNSGTAAPEADGAFLDITSDDMLADYEYRSDQESLVREPYAANKSETQTAGGVQQSPMEPKFFTERGLYLLTGDPFLPKLTETHLKDLGVLVACVPGKQVYPSTGTQELVGCPVLESENGEYLFVQLPDGFWIMAKLYQ